MAKLIEVYVNPPTRLCGKPESVYPAMVQGIKRFAAVPRVGEILEFSAEWILRVTRVRYQPEYEFVVLDTEKVSC
jgi:hypothetical protein